MQDLHELSKEYNFKIIEDASHAIGGDYKNNKIGSCQYSDISVFSFHPVKIITSGEGGMLLTNRKKIYESALKLRSHGITKNPEEFINTIKQVGIMNNIYWGSTTGLQISMQYWVAHSLKGSTLLYQLEGN